MLYSGAELTRTSSRLNERVSRLKNVETVVPVTGPSEGQSTLNQDTQSALQRFARFVHREKEKSVSPSKPVKRSQGGLPQSYTVQIEVTSQVQGRGALLDIFI